MPDNTSPAVRMANGAIASTLTQKSVGVAYTPGS